MSDNTKTSCTNDVDWSRFGLSDEKKIPGNGERELSSCNPTNDTIAVGKNNSNVKELFEEDQGEENQTPWWKANFFIRSPVLFGTWDGVFTSCMLNIFGVVIFLRTGWMVGNAGVGLSLLIVVLTLLMALIPALSAIGVCERCHVESGGVFFLLAHVLGGRAGGTIGILYVFGMTVSISLFCAGFGESLAQTTNWQSPWAVRVIGLTTALVLLIVVLAGVKWVVKLQLLLLAILMLSVLDFVIGTFAHTDYAAGFTGYRTENMENNAPPYFTDGNNFFVVFGVFFPSACGVLAGINMSGDLKDPSRNIPAGTLGALGISGMLYILFVILLGAVCTREALVSDYMIASKVSLVGVLFLFGLYVSSLSSCLGAQYGAPRILQCISKENIIPLIRPLGSGRGPNKEPVVAALCVAVISMAFILIGNLNALAPIVTMPFLLTYAGIDYAYFKLAMSYDIKQRKKSAEMVSVTSKQPKSYPTKDKTPETKLVIDDEVNKTSYGTNGVHNGDFTKIEPCSEYERSEKDDSKEQENIGKDCLKAEEGKSETKVEGEKREGSDNEGILKPENYDYNDTTKLINQEGNEEAVKKRKIKEDSQTAKKKPYKEERQIKWEIEKQPTSYYSDLCNRWVSLAGAFASILIMFLINWGYALANISVALLVYIYIGQSNPGVSKGVAADFNFFKWIQSLWERLRRKPQAQQQIVVPCGSIPYGVSTYQLTEENVDFANRDRRHHSSVVTASLAPQ